MTPKKARANQKAKSNGPMEHSDHPAQSSELDLIQSALQQLHEHDQLIAREMANDDQWQAQVTEWTRITNERMVQHDTAIIQLQQGQTSRRENLVKLNKELRKTCETLTDLIQVSEKRTHPFSEKPVS